MERNEFFKKISLGLATIVAAPFIIKSVIEDEKLHESDFMKGELSSKYFDPLYYEIEPNVESGFVLKHRSGKMVTMYPKSEQMRADYASFWLREEHEKIWGTKCKRYIIVTVKGTNRTFHYPYIKLKKKPYIKKAKKAITPYRAKSKYPKTEFDKILKDAISTKQT